MRRIGASHPAFAKSKVLTRNENIVGQEISTKTISIHDPSGYGIARLNKFMLETSWLMVPDGMDMREAAVVAAQFKASFVKVKITRRVEIASLGPAGSRAAQSTSGAFMTKSPLTKCDGRRGETALWQRSGPVDCISLNSQD